MSAFRPSTRRGSVGASLRRLLLSAALCVLQLPAQAAAPVASPLPAIPLADLRGENAIRSLGSRLPEIAARYRISAAKLAELLRRDGSARIDRDGQLYFVEAAASRALAPASAQAGGGPATADFDPATVFQLHSRPGSARTILLDFDGQDLTDSIWNPNRPERFSVEAFTLDADAASFSTAERRDIFTIWQRLAEDFAPFDVDVTTEDPGRAALSRDSEADTVYGTRVQITRNTFIPGCGCGGLAYVGIFNQPLPHPDQPADFLQPAMVFFDALGSTEDGIADAAAHEAGHNLGLLHDGDSLSEYHGPQTPSDSPLATTWAPIMGLPFGARVTQWSNGDYPSASNQQDDFAVIASFGAPAIEDEVSDALDAPGMLTGNDIAGRTQFDRSGVIGDAADIDVYAFAAGSGPFVIDVQTAPTGANLDIEARLYDAAGIVVAQDNPADGTAAHLAGTLPGGVYRLWLDGVGARDPQTGYSDYGSAGQYRLVGSVVGSGLAAPIAAFSVDPTGARAPATIRFDAAAARDPDGTLVDWQWDFGDGTQGSGRVISHRYADGGLYFPALTVRDNHGLSHRVSQPLRIEAGLLRKVWVRDIAMNLIDAPRRGAQCEARVSVIDAFGQPVPNAIVRGSWSGLTRGPASALSGADGVAILLSARISQQGTCTLRVAGVSGLGLSYAPDRNIETTDSFSY